MKKNRTQDLMKQLSETSPMKYANAKFFLSLMDSLALQRITKQDIAGQLEILPQRLSNILNGSDAISDKFIDDFLQAYDLKPVEIVFTQAGQPDSPMVPQRRDNIDLATFRKANNLKQEELADFLGVNRSYISQVETGSCSLSREKLEFLLAQEQYDTTYLVPAYTRLCAATRYYEGKTNGKALEIPLEVSEKIAVGIIGITPDIAALVLAKIPEMREQWLIYGTGEMLKKDLKAIRSTEDAFRPLYESSIRQNTSLQQLIKEKDDEIAALRKALKISSKPCRDS